MCCHRLYQNCCQLSFIFRFDLYGFLLILLVCWLQEVLMESITARNDLLSDEELEVKLVSWFILLLSLLPVWCELCSPTSFPSLPPLGLSFGGEHCILSHSLICFCNF